MRTRLTDSESQSMGEGPLAHTEPSTGRPIDDPAMADRANPRWADPTAPTPDDLRAQPSTNPDGSPNTMPPREPMGPEDVPIDDDAEDGLEDQAARPIEVEPGHDNIREGRGGGTTTPALSEGGESG